MEKVFENLPAILQAAAQSHLGLMALLIAVLGTLAFFFFSKASGAARIGIFLLFFCGAVAFGWEMFSVAPQTINHADKSIPVPAASASIVGPPSPGRRAETTPVHTPVALPSKVPTPVPDVPRTAWIIYRYDIFWCDTAPQAAELLATQVSKELRSAGVNDVRIKRHDAGFRKRAEDQGFVDEITTSASIRYYGADEERASKQVQSFLNGRMRANFELEEVSPKSPTPGILSIVVCPGLSSAQQDARAER